VMRSLTHIPFPSCLQDQPLGTGQVLRRTYRVRRVSPGTESV
jgi:hypothetical protein